MAITQFTSVSSAELQKIKQEEGNSGPPTHVPFEAYKDSHVPPIDTIGYGQTGSIAGMPVVPGLIVTLDTADAALQNYLSKTAIPIVNRATQNVQLNQSQFDALVDAAYNNITPSTAPSMYALIKAGDFNGAADWFYQKHGNFFVTAGSSGVLPGLVTRRNYEGDLLSGTHGSTPTDPQDSTSANDTTNQTSAKDTQALFDEMNANMKNAEADDVSVTWGMRSSQSEISDWIGFKQFLLYLCTRYVPETVLPFIELIPVFPLDPAKDGTVPGALEATYAVKVKAGTLTDIEAAALLAASKLIPPGYDPNRFNLTAKVSNTLAGQTDLFSLDPWQEGYKNLTDFSDSGKLVYAKRAIGLRIYGQLSLTPEAIAGLPSKPGAIGFTSVEINAGSQSDNGIAKITMKLLDVQGNKFTDINSPWAFIFDTRAGAEGGDFWFRYGWQLRLPNPNNKGTDATGFWNHPGWNIPAFSGLKAQLKKVIQQPDYYIYLTQCVSAIADNIYNASQAKSQTNNYVSSNQPSYQQVQDQQTLSQVFSSSVTDYNDATNEISVPQSMLNGPNSPYVKLSILSPELSVDSVTGAMTATLMFMTTGAIAQMIPLVAAQTTKSLVTKYNVITLAQLLVAYDRDASQFGTLPVNNPQLQTNLRQLVANSNVGHLEALLNSGRLSDIATVLGSDSTNSLGSGNNSVDPNLVILKISKDSQTDINTQSSDQTKTLNRWFNQVLEDNECVLLSAATGSGAGLNSRYVITTTQNISDNIKQYKLKSVPPSDPNNPSSTPLQIVLTTEDDVFSFRFQGSLVENIEVSKTDTPNAAFIQANFALNNIATDDSTAQSNTTSGTVGSSVTLQDRTRNLLYLYAQMQNVKITSMAHPWIGPGQYIYIKGMGFFDGKYMVLSVSHMLDKNKFTSEIEAARMLPSASTSDSTTASNPTKAGDTSTQSGMTAAKQQNAQNSGTTNYSSDISSQYMS